MHLQYGLTPSYSYLQYGKDWQLCPNGPYATILLLWVFKFKSSLVHFFKVQLHKKAFLFHDVTHYIPCLCYCSYSDPLVLIQVLVPHQKCTTFLHLYWKCCVGKEEWAISKSMTIHCFLIIDHYWLDRTLSRARFVETLGQCIYTVCKGIVCEFPWSENWQDQGLSW